MTSTTRVAAFAWVAFAALMGFDLPPVPIPGHAAWADAFAALAAGATLLAWMRGELRISLVGGAALSCAGYVAWAGCSALQAGPPFGAAPWKLLGVAELGTIMVVTCTLVEAQGAAARDRVVRAWTAGALVLGVVGIVVGVAAQTGMNVLPLHMGDGDLGWRFRPAGLQRVGLLAELCLAPLIIACVDGERLFGARRHAIRAALALVLLATCTRTIVAALVAAVLWRVRSRALRVIGISLLGLGVLTAARFDPYQRGPFGMRWKIATSALTTARTHPWFGVGPTGDVAVATGPAPGDPPTTWDAHDTALELAARYGFPGLAFALCTALLVWRRTREVPALDRALRLALAATAFDSFSVELSDSRHVWLLMGLAAARHATGTSRRPDSRPALPEPAPA